MNRGTSGLVVVAGASSGIGQETARLFARAGWDCLAGVRSAEARRAWFAEGTTDRAIARHVVPIKLDVADEADRDGVVREVRARGGKLNALVNAAGIASPGAFAFGDAGSDRDVIETNLLGPMALARQLVPALRAGAHDASNPASTSMIVNVASIAGIAPMPWQSTYHAAKFGLVGWSDAVGQELKHEGIHVVTVLPGTVRTPMLEKADQLLDASIRALPPTAPKPYLEGLTRFRRSARLAARFAATPNAVGKAIVNLASRKDPPRRVIIGADAHVIRAVVAFLPHRLAMAALGSLLS
jgi:NAD(P)-dependent dehydrogenase (short-subunit alcohol dehydrogenase family)